jgi:hypothetical protein
MLWSMAAKISRRVIEPIQVFFEKTDRDVAGVAQQSADVTTLVVMVDTEVVQKGPLVLHQLCRRTNLPKALADCTAPALVLKNFLQRFKADPIAP